MSWAKTSKTNTRNPHQQHEEDESTNPARMSQWWLCEIPWVQELHDSTFDPLERQALNTFSFLRVSSGYCQKQEGKEGEREENRNPPAPEVPRALCRLV